MNDTETAQSLRRNESSRTQTRDTDASGSDSDGSMDDTTEQNQRDKRSPPSGANGEESLAGNAGEVGVNSTSRSSIPDAKDPPDYTREIKSTRRIWKSKKKLDFDRDVDLEVDLEVDLHEESKPAKSLSDSLSRSKYPSQGMNSLSNKDEWSKDEWPRDSRNHRLRRAPSVERPLSPSSSFSGGVSEGDQMAKNASKNAPKNAAFAAIKPREHSKDQPPSRGASNRGKPKSTGPATSSLPLAREDSASHRVGAIPVDGRASGAIPVWARHRPNQNYTPGVAAREVHDEERSDSASGPILPSTQSVARANLVDDAEAIIEATNVESEVKQRNRRLCIIFALVLTVCIAVVVSVSIATSNNKDDGPAEIVVTDPCDNPAGYVGHCLCNNLTIDDDLYEDLYEDMHEDIREALDLLRMKFAAILPPENVSSACDPQSLAIHWLVDTLNISKPQKKRDFYEYVAQGSTAEFLLVQRFVLATCFFSLNGNITKTHTWENETATACDWPGVTCTPFGRVEQLSLSYQGLTGSIPSEIGQLSYLKILQLAGNPGLEGRVPVEVLGIRSLRVLDLRRNKLTGTLAELVPRPNQSALDELLLDGNLYEGAIPTEFGLMTRLRKLHIEGNRLTGPIPSEMGQMTDLVELKLTSNKLNETVPQEVASLKYMQELLLRGNRLSGGLPTSINQTWGLRILDFAGNNFTGPNRAHDYCANVPTLDLVFVDCTELDESETSTRCGDGKVDEDPKDGQKCRCICETDQSSSTQPGYINLNDAEFVL